MNPAPFTAYIEVEWDSTNEGNYKKLWLSLDVQTEELGFVALLPQSKGTIYDYEILRVSIWPSSRIVSSLSPSEHFSSVREFLEKVGGVNFLNEPPKP